MRVRLGALPPHEKEASQAFAWAPGSGAARPS
uniref:Uncharacterized protein n=1 Tax=Arundo donax TaxID=35708 RepID=A0A0A9HQL8_ARUDO